MVLKIPIDLFLNSQVIPLFLPTDEYVIPRCGISQLACAWVYAWMSRNPSVLEESITDWMLDFFEMMDPSITYHGWNRWQEGRVTGADWDWWFLSGGQAFALRVQAKKVYQGGFDHYADLARTNKSGMQIDKLLASSQRSRLYPVYALYGDNRGIGRFHRDETIVPTSVSICSAQDLYDAVFGVKKKKVFADKLLNMSFPLQMLFCTRLGAPTDVQGVMNLIRKEFEIPPRGMGEDGEADKERGFFSSVPASVRRLSDMRRSRENAGGIVAEYQNEFGGSSGALITVLDAVEEDSDE